MAKRLRGKPRTTLSTKLEEDLVMLNDKAVHFGDKSHSKVIRLKKFTEVEVQIRENVKVEDSDDSSMEMGVW